MKLSQKSDIEKELNFIPEVMFISVPQSAC